MSLEEGMNKAFNEKMEFYSTSAKIGDQTDVVLPKLANQLWQVKKKQVETWGQDHVKLSSSKPQMPKFKNW